MSSAQDPGEPRQTTAASFIRYAVVGVVQNGVMLGAMMLLQMNGLAVWQAMGICYPAAICLSFLANRLWSFSSRPRRKGQFLAYAAVYVAAYPFAMGVAWLGEAIGLGPLLSAIASIVASAAFIFLALSFWVFRGLARS